MTIGELRALPVGRGQIGEVRYLPVGVAPRGRGRGHGGRDVTASIARIGVKLPLVGQHQEKKGFDSMVKEELDSLKPSISENPWVRNDMKRNKLLEKMKNFVSRGEEISSSLETSGAPDDERNSVKREDLKRELDEVLRGIREMGGVGAICREREAEAGQVGDGVDSRQEQVVSASVEQRERMRQENLWRKPHCTTNSDKIEEGKTRPDVEKEFEQLLNECKDMIGEARQDVKVDTENTNENEEDTERSGAVTAEPSDVEDASCTGPTDAPANDTDDEEDMIKKALGDAENNNKEEAGGHEDNEGEEEPYLSITPM